MRRIVWGVVLALVSACVTTRFELDHWYEVRTEHFTVITNANEDRAQDLARALEFFRAAALRLAQLHDVEDRVPTRFYLFRSKETYRAFQLDRGVVGYFMQPLDGNLLVANLDPVGLRPADVLFHEYTHLLLRNQDSTFPIWFDEGFAEFLSTMLLSEQELVEFGRPPLRRMQDLHEATDENSWLPLAEILKVRTLGDVKREQKSTFYAQSWLAVHFLFLGHLSSPDFPDYSENLHRYLDLMNDGGDAEAAFVEAFHKQPDEIDAEMRAYFETHKLSFLTYPYQEFPFSERVEARRVPRAEALTQLGELMLALGRPRDASSFMRRAVALQADSARALAGLARTANTPGEQEVLFDRALAADPNDGIVYGWRANELADSIQASIEAKQLDLDPSRFLQARRLAERCIALRPDLPLGYVLEGRLFRLTDPDPDRAIASFERAHELLPSHPRTSLWLGEVYADAGRREQALRLLRKVQQLAHFDELSEEATRRIEALEQSDAPVLAPPVRESAAAPPAQGLARGPCDLAACVK